MAKLNPVLETIKTERPEMKSRYCLAALTLTAVGCSMLPSVGPDYNGVEVSDRAFELPDAGFPTTNLTATCEYRAAESNADDRLVISNESIRRWWTRFNDPVLSELIENSATNSLTFKMALKRLERANWEILGVEAAFAPRFDIGGNWNRSWYRRYTSHGSHTQYNAARAALDASWEIDVFGGTRRATEAAHAEAEAEAWSVADTWVILATRIASEYVNLRTMQSRLEVARTNLVLQSETYDILKSRLDSGIGDELAVNQCAYIVEQTRARIPQLVAAEEAGKNALAILAGLTPGSLHGQLAPLGTRRDWLVEPQRLAEMPISTMLARPDVKAAERRLAAQTARIGVAKAQWFPRFFLTGTVGFEATPDSHKIFARDSFFASLGPSVSWPIFQGGAIYANVKATEARLGELALAFEQTVDEAYGQVRDAYSSYTQEYHRFQALKAAVKAATDAVTISKDLYKNGLKDFNNVLDAQRSRLQLEEEFVISRGQITQNLISLYRALGGGLTLTDEEINASLKN